MCLFCHVKHIWIWRPHSVSRDRASPAFPFIRLQCIAPVFRATLGSKMADGAPAITSAFYTAVPKSHGWTQWAHCLTELALFKKPSQKSHRHCFTVVTWQCLTTREAWKCSLLVGHVVTSNKIRILWINKGKRGIMRQLTPSATLFFPSFVYEMVIGISYIFRNNKAHCYQLRKWCIGPKFWNFYIS